MTVVIEAQSGYQVGPPAVLKTLGDLDVIDTAPPLRSNPTKDVTRFTLRYWVTSFTLGDTGVPRIQIDYSTPEGVVDSVTTTPIAIRVVSVIRDGEDASDIKPLKPQLELPGQARDRYLAWGAIALALGAAVVGAVVLYRRARRGLAIPGVSVAPATATLAELKRIGELHLPEKGRSDEHYALLAVALRRYLADRYGLPAERRTARELHAAMDRVGIERRQASAIYETLREAEAVRFQRAVRQPRHAQQALAGVTAALAKVASAERRGTEPVG